ncbi:MAG TPA: isocitrate lyase/phosphoenolpyruvate mutase family protein [Bryobacteraceae bacterium]|jgi:2-methylisocitrate lyase-like PEP mutase family enzyme|nr:isocitrate lyase/phosphoenolpyruvate mutase family protein [Bryobacteraceae bacterium]
MPGKAEILRKLHQGPRILVLPNAWDVASARIFEAAGFPAIATSSAGVANALGYPDGEKIPRDEMIWMVKRVARAVSVPVTADMEAGYGDPVGTALAVMDAGAVGMNFEDSSIDGSLANLATQVRSIEQIRAASDIVINARTDVYLFGVGDEATRFDRTVERLNAYHKAGADSLFVPGVRDVETIGRLAKAVTGPLNVLATAGAPSIAELERLGVRRVSVGSGPMRASMGLTQRIAKELKDHGTFASMTDGAMSYKAANELFMK